MTGEVAFIEEDEVPTTTVGDPAFPGRTPARRGNVRDEQAVREGEQEPYPGGMKSSDDKFFTDFFLQGTTHLDSLGHAWYGDQIYNGFDAMTTAETKTFERELEGCLREKSRRSLKREDMREQTSVIQPLTGSPGGACYLMWAARWVTKTVGLLMERALH